MYAINIKMFKRVCLVTERIVPIIHEMRDGECFSSVGKISATGSSRGGLFSEIHVLAVGGVTGVRVKFPAIKPSPLSKLLYIHLLVLINVVRNKLAHLPKNYMENVTTMCLTSARSHRQRNSLPLPYITSDVSCKFVIINVILSL